MTPDDPHLLYAIRRQDEAAFDCLCDRYREPLRRHLLQILPDRCAVDDVQQEVWLRVWTHADQWDERGLVRTWLFRIATNLALNVLRSRKRRRESPLETPQETDGEADVLAWLADTARDPERLAEQSQRQARLRSLVLDLPEEKRAVFRLIVEDGLEPREVAAALSIPEGTVRSRLHYARQRLARQWEAFEKDGETESEG